MKLQIQRKFSMAALSIGQCFLSWHNMPHVNRHQFSCWVLSIIHRASRHVPKGEDKITYEPFAQFKKAYDSFDFVAIRNHKAVLKLSPSSGFAHTVLVPLEGSFIEFASFLRYLKTDNFYKNGKYNVPQMESIIRSGIILIHAIESQIVEYPKELITENLY